MKKEDERPTGDQGVTLADMRACRPADALGETTAKNKWQLIRYEAEGLSGVMLGANSAVDAPEVTLPLGVSGWHAMYLGFWNPHHAYDGGTKVKLKLTGDPCFRTIFDPEPQIQWTGSALTEAFIRYADLTGKDLILAQHTKGEPQKAYVAYIRLVPLGQEEVREIQRDRARKDTRILYALNDGNGLFYNGPTTREDLLEEVEQYRHSDVGTFVFAVSCGELVNYPSRIGLPWFPADTDAAALTTTYRTLHDGIEALREQDVVPVQALLQHVHDMGIAFHAQFRMAVLGGLPPDQVAGYAHCLTRRRPDLRMVDRDGTPVEKASYAFGEVRQLMLSLIREVAEGYDVDGVNLCFIRGPQYVGYEKVVVDDFKQQHGMDPRTLDENDPRVQRHRAGYLTQFVRDARKLLDEIGRSKGKKLELSAIVYGGEVTTNLFFGLDVVTWLEEDLLDSIFTGGDCEEAILDAIRAHNCKVVYQLYPREDPAAPGAAEAVQTLKGLNIGAEGVWFWDMNFVQTMPEYWEVLRRIGHKEATQAFAEAIPRMKRIPLKTVDGYDICHVTGKGVEEVTGYKHPEMLYIYSGG